MTGEKFPASKALDSGNYRQKIATLRSRAWHMAPLRFDATSCYRTRRMAQQSSCHVALLGVPAHAAYSPYYRAVDDHTLLILQYLRSSTHTRTLFPTLLYHHSMPLLQRSYPGRYIMYSRLQHCAQTSTYSLTTFIFCLQ